MILKFSHDWQSVRHTPLPILWILETVAALLLSPRGMAHVLDLNAHIQLLATADTMQTEGQGGISGPWASCYMQLQGSCLHTVCGCTAHRPVMTQQTPLTAQTMSLIPTMLDGARPKDCARCSAMPCNAQCLQRKSQQSPPHPQPHSG
jgi:hypothetical protein